MPTEASLNLEKLHSLFPCLSDSKEHLDQNNVAITAFHMLWLPGYSCISEIFAKCLSESSSLAVPAAYTLPGTISELPAKAPCRHTLF